MTRIICRVVLFGCLLLVGGQIWNQSPAAAAEPAGVAMPQRGICAHRGASRSHPENTLAAFREAIRLGAHQIELDVNMTRDGHLVLMHDLTVDRTTDGSGRVVDLTLSRIKQLDAGRWKGPEFAGQKVPTLGEALDVMPLDIWLNIHLKDSGKLGTAVAREIVARKRTHQAFLACGHSAAQAAREVDSKILICNMERQGSSTQYVDDTIARDCQFIQLLRGTASLKDMKRLRDAGVRVNYCCTNDPAELQGLYAAGVEFPLVDDVATMIRTAEDLGIEPRH